MSTEPGGADNPFPVSSSPLRPPPPNQRAAQQSGAHSLAQRTTPGIRRLRKIKIFDSPPPPTLRINKGPPSTIPRTLAGSSQSGATSGSASLVAPVSPLRDEHALWLARNQRVRRRREEAEAAQHTARQVLTAASTNRAPPRPRVRFDRTGTPLDPNGYRAPREEELTRQDLLINGVAPTPLETNRAHQHCGICLHVKSHPVSYMCGHSHCYCCIRLWLEHRWVCPTCRTVMTRPPHRNYEEEAGLALDFPDRIDESLVNYSWDGLNFPRHRVVYVDSDEE
ncbi:hypothetical protein B0H11DRAFT_2229111 [Mycena galericulata]|nr:hypothetical protein B0H11DRAFT_2229111 [Mycena galericulata]